MILNLTVDLLSSINALNFSSYLIIFFRLFLSTSAFYFSRRYVLYIQDDLNLGERSNLSAYF